MYPILVYLVLRYQELWLLLVLALLVWLELLRFLLVELLL